MRAVLLALAGLMAPVTAQTYDTVLEAVTDLWTGATQGLLLTYEYIPAGRQISGSITLNRAVTTWLWAQSKATATFAKSLDATSGRTTITVDEQVDVNRTLISFPSMAECGEHSLRLTITPREQRQLTGIVRVIAGFSTPAVTSAAELTATLTVDIGEDGAPEYSRTGWFLGGTPPVFHVIVPSTGLKVLITTHLMLDTEGAYVPVSDSSARSFAMDFVPDPMPDATFLSYGTRCGPWLYGEESFASGRRLTYGVHSAPKSAPGALAFGVQRTLVTLPGGCTAFTEHLAVVAMNTDPTGRASLTLAVPAQLLGVVNAQFLGLSGSTLVASAGLEMASETWP